MFMSGMNSFPSQLPSFSDRRCVKRGVPTRWGVVFLASCLALSLAQAMVPQGPCPQPAIFMMLLPPGLRQIPSIDDELCAAVLKATVSASANSGLLLITSWLYRFRSGPKIPSYPDELMVDGPCL